jgi:hypothetical protein
MEISRKTYWTGRCACRRGGSEDCYYYNEFMTVQWVFKEYRSLTKHFLFVILFKTFELYGMNGVLLLSALAYTDQGEK